VSKTFEVNVYTAGNPGSIKIPPNYKSNAGGSSASVSITPESLIANPAPQWQATALLLASDSFLNAAEQATQGEHADKLRAAGQKLQSMAADLILQAKR